MPEFKVARSGEAEGEFRQFLAYLFSGPGVVSGLSVAQTASASASVTISAGLANVVRSTLAGSEPLINNATKTLDVLTANPLGGTPRNDIIVFDADTSTIRAILGDPNAVPTDPTVPASAIALARLRHITANAGTIPSSAIDDLRTFTGLTSGTAWRDYTPTLYHNMTTTPVAIGTDVTYGRWRYASPNTVQAQGVVTRQAGATTSGGIAVALPVPGAIRSLDCGSLIATGSTIPASQAGIAMMSPDRTKLILTNYTAGYLDLAAFMGIRFNVTYEV